MPLTTRLLAIAAAVTAVAAAAPASAATRKQADRAAIRTLRTSPSEILFRTPRPLPAGTAIFEAGPSGPNAPNRGVVRRQRRKVWLYWEDGEPYARFEHASQMALVDARSGRVVKREAMSWWPAIVGPRSRRALRPPWLRSRRAYESRRFRVLPRRGRPPRARTAGAQPPGPGGTGLGPPPVARLAQRPLLGADDFKDDCLVQIGDRTDRTANFAGDLNAMGAWADSVGLRRQRANGVDDMFAIVAEQTRDDRCKDVFLQISGHGRAPPGTIENGVDIGGSASVNVKKIIGVGDGPRPGTLTYTYTDDRLTPDDLGRLFLRHPRTTFKVKIDACYAGRFKPLAERFKNLLVIEMAASANESALSHIPQVTGANGRPIRNPTVNRYGAGEFTNGNVAGLTRWSTTQAEIDRTGRALAAGIARSFTLGADQDWARTLRFTTPEIATNPPPQQQPPPQQPPPQQQPITIAFSNEGWDHTRGDGSGWPSSVCTNGRINGSLAGATIVAERVPEGGQGQKSVAVAEDGSFYVKFGINSQGTYRIRVIVTRNGERTVSETGDIVVPAPAGNKSRDCV